MASFKTFIYLLVAVAFVIAVGFIVESNYSLIFSRHVSGQIVSVERVNSTLAVVGADAKQSGLYSFAVAIRDQDGTIHTARSDDPQWAAVKPGFCADAIFYPYPFWNMQHAGNYQDSRLLQMRDCPQPIAGAQGAAPAVGPVATPAPVEAQPAPAAPTGAAGQ